MQEPSADVLRAFGLSPAQFHILADLADHPDGLMHEALQHGASDGEIEALQQRNLIVRTGDHYHSTLIGRGMMKAIQELGLAEA